MTHRTARCLVAGAALVLVAAALAACSSDAKVAETADGRVTVSGTGKKAEVTVNGEHGATATYNAQQVPADFPDAVPLPTRWTLSNATSATREGKRYFQLSYDIGANSARASLGFYASLLGEAGFAVDTVDGATSDPAPSPLQADGKGWRVVAIATSGGGNGSMIVTVTNA